MSALDTLDLKCFGERILQNEYNKFLGVFAADDIPISIITQERFRPVALVVNTDKKDEPGTHWIGVYKEPNRPIEFFDSYGFHPSHYPNLVSFIQNQVVIHNNTTYQDLTSSVCGHYALFYLFFRSHCFSPSYINRLLSSHRASGVDQFVATFIFNLRDFYKLFYPCKYLTHSQHCKPRCFSC